MTCSFCDKPRSEVAGLVSRQDGGGVAICNECVGVALFTLRTSAIAVPLEQHVLDQQARIIRAEREETAFFKRRLEAAASCSAWGLVEEELRARARGGPPS